MKRPGLHNSSLRTKLLPLKLIFSLSLVMAGFFYFSGTSQAAACTPAAGFGTVTKTGVTSTSAGAHNVWVRMQAADAISNSVGVEVTQPGGTPSCLIATSTSVTGWQWRNAGSVNVSTTGNTIKLVGLAAKVRVDRVLLIPANSTCIPSNTRNTTKNPIEEPGDNCVVPTTTPTPTTTTTTTVTPSTSTSTTPSPSVSPTPTPQPPSSDTAPPTVPAGLTRSLVLDIARFRYNLELKWVASTDNSGKIKDYVVRRNGVDIGTSASPAFVDTTVEAGIRYVYDVRARDSAGNLSNASTSISATGQCFLVWCWLQ